MSQRDNNRAAFTIRDPPTCDGRNTEVWHGNAVKWIKVHELLPVYSPLKYPKSIQGLILISGLTGTTKNIAEQVPDSILHSDNGVVAVINAVHRRDPLPAMT